jgi:hypothetical protein
MFLGAAAAIALTPFTASATTVGGYTYTPDAAPFNLEFYDLYDGAIPVGSVPATNNMLSDGSILSGNLFTGTSTGGGGIVFKFTAAEAGLFAVNVSTTNPGSPFDNLRISWCTGTAVGAQCIDEESFIEEPLDDIELVTNFGNIGDMKFLVANWTGVSENASNLDFRVAAAVPVPAAVWLFGSGLLGLVGIARRKKA